MNFDQQEKELAQKKNASRNSIKTIEKERKKQKVLVANKIKNDFAKRNSPHIKYKFARRIKESTRDYIITGSFYSSTNPFFQWWNCPSLYFEFHINFNDIYPRCDGDALIELSGEFVEGREITGRPVHPEKATDEGIASFLECVEKAFGEKWTSG